LQLPAEQTDMLLATLFAWCQRLYVAGDFLLEVEMTRAEPAARWPSHGTE
jgi:hypothetical protein